MNKRNIESILKNTPAIQPPAHLKENLCASLNQLESDSPIDWNMKKNAAPGYHFAWRYVAAALLVFSLFSGIWILDQLNNGNVAWADVVSQARTIGQVHFYGFEFDENGLQSSQESWYVNGRVIDQLANGGCRIDDGESRTEYNRQGDMTHKDSSWFDGLNEIAGEQDLFKVLTQGIFAYPAEEINASKPIEVGEDFLVYRFGKPQNDFSINEITITVGRRSLLPLQLKVYFKSSKSNYMMYVFDYEQKQIPASLVKLAGIDSSSEVKLAGKWRGVYESQYGERGDFVAIITNNGQEYSMVMKESFEDWAPEICQVKEFSFQNNTIYLSGEGYNWTGTAKGTLEQNKISGTFDGNESGTFKLTKLLESGTEMDSVTEMALIGKWRGVYESQYGERGDFVAIITRDGRKYSMVMKESFEDWASEICQVKEFSFQNNTIYLSGEGYNWTGTAKGTLEQNKISGTFDGNESGSFTLTKLQASGS